MNRTRKAFRSLTKGDLHTTGLPIIVSPGVIPENVPGRLSEAEVFWYACYQETHRV